MVLTEEPLLGTQVEVSITASSDGEAEAAERSVVDHVEAP
jgi:hypothetical protein